MKLPCGVASMQSHGNKRSHASASAHPSVKTTASLPLLKLYCIFGDTRGGRASTGLCVDVSSGVMI